MGQENRRSRTQTITLAAVMAALIFVVTMFVRAPISTSAGAYLNFGDVVIYICAYLMGGPVTAVAAAVGSMFADLAVGAAVYAVPTLVIKGLIGFVAGTIARKHTFGLYLLACAAGGAIMTGGYALFEYFAFGTAYMVGSLPMNLIQWGGSIAAAAVCYPALRPIEKALMNMRHR